jgi:hypothetical protein
MEVLVILLLVSGFGLAYALLFPSLYVTSMIFGDSGQGIHQLMVFGIQFLQFFIPVFLVLYGCKYGRNAA